MPEKERLFLTIDEALDAVRNDFSQYSSQLNLFSAIWPMVFGVDAYLMREPKSQTVWAKTPDAKKPYSARADELGKRIIRHLKLYPVSPEHMAGICTRVFQTPVAAGFGPGAASPTGIWIDTGMSDFVCIQCGRCCRTLNYHDGCTVDDYRRLQALGRTDILAWVGTVRQNGEVTACRIWMDPGTNRFADNCPWLKKSDEPGRYVCTIHDVRPMVCREYPGSRKHARMTGCGGI
ncbi:MAG: YkgJ family cysteine cluster protein [Desulfosarcina sp.]|nr:YkgJ family cysteine cluster protein [Desulfosarcina sp.]MBC2745198.1 YkgJ family cysteine cluster protein [Desulfosarcina sp.]MBC2768106.1 YkgJ family cysteine cluster protein [Desulfosarcina sp.]